MKGMRKLYIWEVEGKRGTFLDGGSPSGHPPSSVVTSEGEITEHG